jgi:hypothetical protein
MKQKLSHMTPKQKRHVSLSVLIALLLAATLLWVMNIENIILGPWSNIISAIFTAFSVVITLIQLHTQSLPEGSLNIDTLPPQKKHENYNDSISLGVNKRRGAVIVYTSRKLRGKLTLLVSSSQEENSCICMNSNIVERINSNRKVFSSIFPSVQPGHYTISIQSQQLSTDITVFSGCISEIDWR